MKTGKYCLALMPLLVRGFSGFSPATTHHPPLSLQRGAATSVHMVALRPQQQKDEESVPPVVFLLGASALWGTYPSTIKCLFSAPGAAITPPEVTLLRFLVMASFSAAAFSVAQSRGKLAGGDDEAMRAAFSLGDDAAAPSFRDQLERRVPSSIYVAAAELGALGLAGTLCNTAGLAQIPALTGAVLLTFLNVFVPLIGASLGATEAERDVDRTTWLCSGVALAASIYALIPDTPGQVSLPNLGGGELSVLTAAFFFAAAKVRLSSHLKVHSADALTTGRLVAQAVSRCHPMPPLPPFEGASSVLKRHAPSRGAPGATGPRAR